MKLRIKRKKPPPDSNENNGDTGLNTRGRLDFLIQVALLLIAVLTLIVGVMSL